MRISSVIASVLMLSCSLTFPVASLAQQDDLPELDAMLGNIETLRADVEQLIVESDGGVLEESQIKMQLKKPDGFYWETISPFPELIVTNGELLWNYQPDLEQVVIEDWDSERSELAAQLLNGETENLARDYRTEQAESVTPGIVEFLLTPKATDNVYSEIKITFVADELDMIHLHNKNGEQTVWQFSVIERNQPIPDSEFVFEAPAGIEVIENSYASH